MQIDETKAMNCAEEKALDRLFWLVKMIVKNVRRQIGKGVAGEGRFLVAGDLCSQGSVNA